jgi:hypothetical protein
MVQASSVLTYEIRIFDRWGDEVYYSTNITDAWVGDHRGNNDTYCQNDVYSYVATIKGFNGEAQEYQGTVTLVR